MAEIRANIDRVIATWAGQLGYTERPNGSNCTKFGSWYGAPCLPWCASGASWAFDAAGYRLPAITTSRGFAYVPDLVAWAKRNGQWVSTPGRGYLAVYSFGRKRADHVNVIEALLSPGRISTIGGNEGNAVRRVHRSTSQPIGYVRVVNVGTPAKPPSSNVTANGYTAAEWRAIRRLTAAHLARSIQDMPDLNPGQESLHVALLQQVLNTVAGHDIPVDGKYGPRTVLAVIAIQRFFNAKDREGFAHRFTRFYLWQSLLAIAEGRA